MLSELLCLTGASGAADKQPAISVGAVTPFSPPALKRAASQELERSPLELLNLTPAQRTSLLAMLGTLDRNHDGRLSFIEVHEALAKIGVRLQPGQLRQFMSRADASGDGQVSRAELERMLRSAVLSSAIGSTSQPHRPEVAPTHDATARDEVSLTTPASDAGSEEEPTSDTTCVHARALDFFDSVFVDDLLPQQNAASVRRKLAAHLHRY
jgi:hypothetical protein